MSQLYNGPGDIGCERASLVFILKPESRLDTEASWKILMAHELVVLLGEVAVDGQGAVDLVDEGSLVICKC